MEIKNLLQIGVGKAGNVLLNDIMELDPRYVGLFINSAKGDMENLPHYSKDNSFSIPQTNGSGKDRGKAKEYILKWKESFFELMSSYSEFDTVAFYFSLDGGTGSGSVPTLAALTKNLFRTHYDKDVNIIAIGVVPNSTIGLNGLMNAQECWNDIVKLMNNHKDEFGEVKVDEYGEEITPTISTLYLIDNNKRNGNYEEINAEAVETLHYAFQFDTLNNTGDLDKNDSANINLSRGYNLLLKLEEAENEEQAILNAKENSVFVMPSKEYYNPENIGLALKEEVFDKNNMTKLIGTPKRDMYPAPIDEEDDIDGAIFFGGIRLGLIKETIKTISEMIKEKEELLKRDNEDDDDLIIEVNRTSVSKTAPTKTVTKKTKPAKAKPTARSSRKIKTLVDNSLFEFDI